MANSNNWGEIYKSTWWGDEDWSANSLKIDSAPPGFAFTGLLDTYTGAAAAYSVRKLSSTYTGDALRVRRSSDDTEQDIGFDANGDLDTTALTTFVNADVDLYTSDFSSTEDLDDRNGTGAAAQSVGGVDDAYKFTLTSDVEQVYEVRIPNSITTGCDAVVNLDFYVPSSNSIIDGIEVRDFGGGNSLQNNTTDAWTSVQLNVSDTTNGNIRVIAIDGTDITPLNGNGDVFYLKNIVVTQTTADGFVTKWYDQSGNTNDAINADASAQPLVVSGGTLVEENGKAAIQFDGVDDELGFLSDISATEVSSVIVAKAITYAINDRFFGWRNSTHSFLSVLSQGANSTTLRGLSQTSVSSQYLQYTGVDYTNQSLISMYNASVWRINGNEFTTAGTAPTTGVRTTNGLTLGSRGGGSNTGNIRFQEAIFFNSDQSTNRTGIETNINDHFDIYTP